ncbi:MAG TPA: hypothetical protein VGL94_10345 [Ktedonobacteraceae bacterium]
MEPLPVFDRLTSRAVRVDNSVTSDTGVSEILSDHSERLTKMEKELDKRLEAQRARKAALGIDKRMQQLLQRAQGDENVLTRGRMQELQNNQQSQTREMGELNARIAGLEKALKDVQQGNDWLKGQLASERDNIIRRQRAVEKRVKYTEELTEVSRKIDDLTIRIGELGEGDRRERERLGRRKERFVRDRDEIRSKMAELSERDREGNARNERITREIDNYMSNLDEGRINAEIGRGVEEYMRTLDERRRAERLRTTSTGADRSRPRDASIGPGTVRPQGDGQRARSADPRVRRRPQGSYTLPDSGILQEARAYGAQSEMERSMWEAERQRNTGRETVRPERRDASIGPGTVRPQGDGQRARSADPRVRRRPQDSSGILQGGRAVNDAGHSYGVSELGMSEAARLVEAANRVGIDEDHPNVDWRNVQSEDVRWGDVARRARITINWQRLNWNELGDMVQANKQQDRIDSGVDWREATYQAGANVDGIEAQARVRGANMDWMDWRRAAKRAQEASSAQALHPSGMAYTRPYNANYGVLQDTGAYAGGVDNAYRAQGADELRRGRRLRRDTNAEKLIDAANRVGIDGGLSTAVDWSYVDRRNVNWIDVANRAEININLQNIDWNEVDDRIRANAQKDRIDAVKDWRSAARIVGIDVDGVERQARQQGVNISWMYWRNEVTMAQRARDASRAPNPYDYSTSTAQALHPSGMADAGPYSATQPVQEAFITEMTTPTATPRGVPTRYPSNLSYNPWA